MPYNKKIEVYTRQSYVIYKYDCQKKSMKRATLQNKTSKEDGKNRKIYASQWNYCFAFTKNQKRILWQFN